MHFWTTNSWVFFPELTWTGWIHTSIIHLSKKEVKQCFSVQICAVHTGLIHMAGKQGNFQRISFVHTLNKTPCVDSLDLATCLHTELHTAGDTVNLRQDAREPVHSCTCTHKYWVMSQGCNHQTHPRLPNHTTSSHMSQWEKHSTPLCSALPELHIPKLPEVTKQTHTAKNMEV